MKNGSSLFFPFKHIYVKQKRFQCNLHVWMVNVWTKKRKTIYKWIVRNMPAVFYYCWPVQFVIVVVDQVCLMYAHIGDITNNFLYLFIKKFVNYITFSEMWTSRKKYYTIEKKKKHVSPFYYYHLTLMKCEHIKLNSVIFLQGVWYHLLHFLHVSCKLLIKEIRMVNAECWMLKLFQIFEFVFFYYQ